MPEHMKAEPQPAKKPDGTPDRSANKKDKPNQKDGFTFTDFASI